MQFYNEDAELAILQLIAQKKDVTLLSTINQNLLHGHYSNLLNTLRLKTENLEYFYCITFCQDNNIDVPLNIIEKVFKGDIRFELEGILKILELKYLQRQMNDVGAYIDKQQMLSVHPLATVAGVQERLSKIKYTGEKIEKLGDNLDTIDTMDLIYSGISQLDSLYLSKQEIMVLGGERGHHKTNFAIHLETSILEHNVITLKNETFKVMFFSREMSFKNLKARLLSKLFRIPFGDIKKGNYNAVEINQIFHEKFWYYHDNFILIRPEQINSVEDVAKYLLQEKPTVWVFDYMQLLARLISEGDVNATIAWLITKFKSIAQVTNTMGVVVSTLSKFEKGRISKVPKLDDLYSSVEIQYLATWVGLCYWSWFYDRTLLKDPFFVLWEKNRNDEPFTMPLKVIPQYSSFESIVPGSVNLDRYLQ